MKALVLQNDIPKISKTKDIPDKLWRGPIEDVVPKPRGLGPMTHWSEQLPVKLMGHKRMLYDTLKLPMPSGSLKR